MKKTLWLLFTLSFISPLIAQTRLVPKTFTFSFQIPIATLYKNDTWDADYKNGTHTQDTIYGFSTNKCEIPFQGNDSIFFKVTSGDTHNGGGNTTKCSFVLDTFNNRITDFVYSNISELQIHGMSREFTQFLRLKPFTYDSGSNMAVNITDTILNKLIDSIFYHTNYSVALYGPNGKYHQEDYAFIGVREIDTSFFLNIGIQYDTIAQTIVRSTTSASNSFISVSASSIDFTLAPKTESFPIRIFDLLGREVYKSEIPPNTSEWVVDWKQKGIYMIQIGNEIQKCIIP